MFAKDWKDLFCRARLYPCFFISLWQRETKRDLFVVAKLALIKSLRVNILLVLSKQSILICSRTCLPAGRNLALPHSSHCE